MIYCVIPRDLAVQLHDVLRHNFMTDPTLEVVVERRGVERRQVPDQRVEGESSEPDADRRKIRNSDGRRVGERRAAQVPVPAPPLPSEAREFAERLLFVERVELNGQHSEDLDTGRLITRLQAGEETAFTDLYLRYFDRVYAYLRVALNDAHEAEDAAQQVFIKVLEALPEYERRRQPFRAWLFRIVRNHAVDHLRKHGHVELEDPGEIDRRREPETEGDMRALQWLTDSDLLVFIERLPLVQRQVLVLRYMMDLSNAEIAEVLDRSTDSIRQLQHRALRFLEERLSALGREPKATARVGATRIERQSPTLNARRYRVAAL